MVKFSQTWLAIVSCLCVLSLWTSGSAKDAPPADAESYVEKLTKDNFDKFVKENDYVLVEFFAPWCGHCKQLAPQYEEAAKTLKKMHEKAKADGKESIEIRLASVDAVEQTELSKKYKIRGYPTLMFFRKGVSEDYSGGRTSSTIVEWLQKMTGPSVVIVESDKEAVEKVGDAPRALFFGEFESEKDAVYKKFHAFADKHRASAKFFASFVPGRTAKQVKVYRGNEGWAKSISLTESTPDEELEKFWDLERFPFFGPVNADNYADYFANSRSIVWFVGEPSHYESAGDVIRSVAKHFRAGYSFVWLDSAEFKEHAESALGVKEYPSLVVQQKEGRYIYPEHSFTSDKSLIAFLEAVVAGKVERHLMSDPIPEKNDDPVTVVVGKEFKKLVLRDDADVMLEVYAPWCGHCKKFEPIYNEFAEKMAPYKKKFVVAKMDGTTNESPVDTFTWNSFPTIFFVKAGTKEPVTYDQDRTIEGLVKFVKKHSTTLGSDDGGALGDEL